MLLVGLMYPIGKDLDCSSFSDSLFFFNFNFFSFVVGSPGWVGTKR